MTPGPAPAWNPGRAGWLPVRALALLLLALTSAHLSVASAQTAPAAGKPRIAVLEFSGVGVTEAETAAVTEEIRSDLFKSGRFEVLERSRIDAVLNEQALQQAAVATEDAVKAGKLLDVQYIVTGRLTSPSPGTYHLSAQAIDVETGRITASDTAQHEGGILGLLEKLPALTARAVAKLFEEAPPPAAQAPAPPPEPLANTKPPLTLRVFGGPYTLLSVNLAPPGKIDESLESINAEAITLGFEQFFTDRLSGTAAMHLGRVTDVEMTNVPGQPTRTVSASGSFSMLSLGGGYNWRPGNWVLFAGGEVYFAALDYSFPDFRLSGGQETRWTITARGIGFRGGADYVLENDVFIGMSFFGDLFSNYSGSRIDALQSNGGVDTDLSNVIAIVFRVGYNF